MELEKLMEGARRVYLDNDEARPANILLVGDAVEVMIAGLELKTLVELCLQLESAGVDPNSFYDVEGGTFNALFSNMVTQGTAQLILRRYPELEAEQLRRLG
jgi:hypothetical protein